MSAGFNTKYTESGSLFQGGYRGKSVSEDSYMNYLVFYVLVKNVLDMYPGGLKSAVEHFDAAWDWAASYPYSSFRDIITGIESPILQDVDGLVVPRLRDPSFKKEALELLQVHLLKRGDEFADVMLEHW